jgi:7-carboxy-7-deazaguanine synthase
VKKYTVKEVYYTMQGEGAMSGRPSVFCRFSGCNLWTGREKDREAAICNFCDTDFVGTDGLNGGTYSAEELAYLVVQCWPNQSVMGNAYVVCTGGEPLLQLDKELVESFHSKGMEVGIETNGTIPCTLELDWICVSPKSNSHCVLRKGNELKLIFPQQGLSPNEFLSWDFDHFYLQPMDGPDLEENVQKSIAYCLDHPNWKLSLQIHKLIGLP